MADLAGAAGLESPPRPFDEPLTGGPGGLADDLPGDAELFADASLGGVRAIIGRSWKTASAVIGMSGFGISASFRLRRENSRRLPAK